MKNPSSTIDAGHAGSVVYRDSSSSGDYRPPAANCNERIVELEIENARLHRLVSELLIKNQQLRKPD